jgi:hypothetical protein
MHEFGMVRMSGALTAERAALVQLGRVLEAIGQGRTWPGHASGLVEAEYRALDRAVREAHITNGWATEQNVRFACSAWAEALRPASVDEWIARYPELERTHSPQFTVGLVLAGNVPLVGLHDVLCVWLSGHRAAVKCSSQEPALLPAVVAVLDRFAPGTMDRIRFLQGPMSGADAVIATGSDNTARYFEHYFGHLPRIVRRNRVSVAILDGTETPAELQALAEEVFRYFGLGCRNVSKVMLPRDFDLDRLFGAFFSWQDIVHHKKYGNNYDYTRALWMLDGVPFLENGFLLVRETEELASPVATLFVERYDDAGSLAARMAGWREKLQCVVGHGHVPFGQAQTPQLWDYADGADTMRFLLDLSRPADPLR